VAYPQPMRVMVVEDEPLIASFIAKGLTSEGHGVEIVERGDDALDRFAAEAPDLVLLDVMLPKISGIDVCRYRMTC